MPSESLCSPSGGHRSEGAGPGNIQCKTVWRKVEDRVLSLTLPLGLAMRGARWGRTTRCVRVRVWHPAVETSLPPPAPCGDYTVLKPSGPPFASVRERIGSWNLSSLCRMERVGRFGTWKPRTARARDPCFCTRLAMASCPSGLGSGLCWSALAGDRISVWLSQGLVGPK